MAIQERRPQQPAVKVDPEQLLRDQSKKAQTHGCGPISDEAALVLNREKVVDRAVKGEQPIHEPVVVISPEEADLQMLDRIEAAQTVKATDKKL